jgi:hypothetical protein
MSNTALVLARPERRRILREVLGLPEPWSAYHRQLYRKMLEMEYMDRSSDDDFADHIEKYVFCDLVVKGTRPEEACESAAEAAREAVADRKRERSPARRERERRRTFREAVTNFQGGIAVTTGMVEACVTCSGPFFGDSRRRGRRDAAYCSNAYRQAAYRKRKRAGQPISAEAKEKIREQREIAAVLARLGITRKRANRWAQLAEIPEDELDNIVHGLPRDDSARILALHRRAQGHASGMESQPAR